MNRGNPVGRNYRRIFFRRVCVSAVAVVAMSAVLIINLMVLQIDKRGHYSTLAENNRLHFSAIAPSRGVIYDRNGAPLAVNRSFYRLEVTPSLVGEDLDEMLARLRRVVAFDASDAKRFKQTVARQPSFRTAVLKAHLTQSEIARFAVDRYRFSGVEVVGELGRRYPYREVFAHAVGYVGLLDRDDLAAVDQRRYRGTRYIGKVGLEKTYEETLRGNPGVRTAEVNAQGRVIREISKRSPQAGRDVLLTLDRDLQAAAYDALGDYEGAVVVMDPRNGDVLALVSKPAFDPNRFLSGFSFEAYQGLLESPRRHFFNRAVSGQYPPGSVIKPIVALAGLGHNVTSPDYYIFAGPYFSVPGNTRRFHDWKPAGHGWVSLRESIAQSCDVYFYDLAYRTGIDKLHQAFRSFGLGRSSGLDITSEAAGLVPSREWKQQQLRMPWFPEETVITGIGQGYLSVTPLQLASVAATIANRGLKVKPRLVRAVREREGRGWEARRPVNVGVVEFSPEHWQLVVDGMVDVVHGQNGTAYRIGADAPYTMAGKTGTAQTYSISEEERARNVEVTEKSLMDHALFIAFAPVDAPTVAIAVTVEHVGSGAKHAAPIARQVLDVYFQSPTAEADAPAPTSG